MSDNCQAWDTQHRYTCTALVSPVVRPELRLTLWHGIVWQAAAMQASESSPVAIYH